jgi:plastocyanin
MKRLLAVLAAACVAGAALPAIPALATTRTVAVKDSYFATRSLTVRKGTTVKWVWRGTNLPHNIVVRKGPEKFSSGAPKRSGSFARTLRRRGAYRLRCTIHPGMEMSVTVR